MLWDGIECRYLNGLTGATVLFPKEAVFNGLVYLADQSTNTGLTAWYVYNPIGNTFTGPFEWGDNYTPAAGPSIDEVNQRLYIVANNNTASVAELLTWNISGGNPVFISALPIPAPGGNPSGVTGQVYCPSNNKVYCAVAGQAGGQLIRYNADTGLFENPTPLDNSSIVVAMSFNPNSNLIFVQDTNSTRVICADSDNQIGTIAVLPTAFTPVGFDNSMAMLDLNTGVDVKDFA